MDSYENLCQMTHVHTEQREEYEEDSLTVIFTN